MPQSTPHIEGEPMQRGTYNHFVFILLPIYFPYVINVPYDPKQLNRSYEEYE